ncbi:MAG: 23S rRNA (guanosine(2251)-2'-O)-methyltransferase RlmB [Pseudomonadota bacterium]
MLSSLFGIHAVAALLSHQPESVQALCLVKGTLNPRLLALEEKAKKNNIRIRYETSQTLDAQTNGAAHQGVIAMVENGVQPKALTNYSENMLPEFLETIEVPFLLILDTVQDPHNLGACLRSANAAGVHAVIVPKDKSVGLTPAAIKVACGAAEFTPFFQVTNLARTLELLKQKGIWLFGAAGEASATIYQQDFSGPIAIVLGNEESGLRRLTREHCDHLFQIPMCGQVESLNVSVAAGVCLFEAQRQRINIK